MLSYSSFSRIIPFEGTHRNEEQQVATTLSIRERLQKRDDTGKKYVPWKGSGDLEKNYNPWKNNRLVVVVVVVVVLLLLVLQPQKFYELRANHVACFANASGGEALRLPPQPPSSQVQVECLNFFSRYYFFSRG